ncbi:hypothetical protein BZG36_04501 [Bifiguratus adelaidae]|uniref:DUS-like FMN-binding domain-containing protein n=1 Tax=Bifiguratus adelaidae TaxID=1938954 RepID=A0A261XW29_9FUNG|nr:hypothetical protein BZG36_04501 [Bifiguratus adelaidae]
MRCAVAPMIDVTHQHFLAMLHLISPRFTLYTEMLHANAIVHNRGDLFRLIGEAHPHTVVQLGGSDPAMMAKAVALVQREGFEQININCGCPSDRVQHGNFGAVLMKDPELVARMLDAIKETSHLPVTIKHRLGVDDTHDSDEHLHCFVRTLTSCHNPPHHLIVHARKCWLKGLSPRQNRTVPPLQYDRVKRLKEAFPDLQFTLNGGIDTVDKVRWALEHFDGVMLGRKIMDDPLFLATLDQALHFVTSPTSVSDLLIAYHQYLCNLRHHPRFNPTYQPSTSLLLKPLFMLYKGSQGRQWRTLIASHVQAGKKHKRKAENVLEDIINDWIRRSDAPSEFQPTNIPEPQLVMV